MPVDLDLLLAKIQNRPDDIERLFADLAHLPLLADHIRALALYSRELTPGSKFIREGERYVLTSNFVAFTPRYKRSQHVTIELRGNTKEFEQLDGLKVVDARAGSYAKCDFRRPTELAAAASYIKRAHALYKRGAKRGRTKPKTEEVVAEP